MAIDFLRHFCEISSGISVLLAPQISVVTSHKYLDLTVVVLDRVSSRKEICLCDRHSDVTTDYTQALWHRLTLANT
jgi:hypothetical protein